jgi:hypothetical protein
MKLIECKKTREQYEENTVPGIKGVWQEGEKKVSEVWHSVRAGIIYPTGKQPGCLVVGGQTFEKKIRVLAETTFPVLSRLVEKLPELTKTLLLSRIYHEGTDEAIGFCTRVRAELRNRDDHEKAGIPNFRQAYRAEFPAFGNDLIREYLMEGKLLIPSEGELASQMQGSWQEEEEDFYAAKALRYLVSGFHFEPFRPPYRRPPSPRQQGPGSWMGR